MALNSPPSLVLIVLVCPCLLAVAFATVAAVATINAKVPWLSLPRSSTLGDIRHSAGIDGIAVIIVVVVHPPCATSGASNAFVNVDPPLPLPLPSYPRAPLPSCPLALAGLALALVPSSAPARVALAPCYRRQRQPLSPPLTTAIAAATVDDGNRQKPAVVVCRQQQQ